MTGSSPPAPEGPLQAARRARGGVRYEFLLAGGVSDLVVAAFPELTVGISPGGGTALFGPVADDAQLYGLLDRFQSFGLSVVELRQLPD